MPVKEPGNCHKTSDFRMFILDRIPLVLYC